MADEPRPAKRVRSEVPAQAEAPAPAPHAAYPFDVDNCYLTTLETKHANGCPLAVGHGYGLAFCQETGQLAQSRFEHPHTGQPGAVIMFSIARAKKTGTPSLVMEWETHLPFCQVDLSHRDLGSTFGRSGALAFTEDGPPLLLSADHYDRFVRVLNPADGTSLGRLAPPSGIDGPRGVSTWGSLVAVSFWKDTAPGNGGVTLFQRSGQLSWTQLWSVTATPLGVRSTFLCPQHIRLSRDGEYIAVTSDGRCDNVRMLSTKNGDTVDYWPKALGNAWDTEECRDGWFISCYAAGPGRPAVDFVTAQDGYCRRKSLPGNAPEGHPAFELADPLVLVMVPGLGLVGRHCVLGQDTFLYTTPDLVAMGAMSALRVAWITVVVRGVFRRARK